MQTLHTRINKLGRDLLFGEVLTATSTDQTPGLIPNIGRRAAVLVGEAIEKHKLRQVYK